MLTGNAPYDFLADRVKADASGECFEDTEVSTLLTSRIRLGEDFEDTVDNDAWPMAACVGDEAGPDSPNPCYIEGQRPSIPTSDNSRFHKFLYDGREVQAIRFSNPMMSLTLDLTSLLDLDAEIPGHEGARWPAEFADFRRSRIPRLYTQLFRTVPGYIPYNEGVVLNGEPLLGPVRVINAPEKGAIFIVDAGGRGSVYGLRGQVMRVRLVPQVLADDTFRVR